MFTLAHIVYLALGGGAVVVGFVILRAIAARANRGGKNVSQTLGYSAIMAILTLWGTGFLALGAGSGLNPNMLGQ